MNLEEELGFNSDEGEPFAPSSSDDDSAGSEFQGTFRLLRFNLLISVCHGI